MKLLLHLYVINKYIALFVIIYSRYYNSMMVCHLFSIVSVTSSIDVVGSATDGRFRVQCTSTGGIALSMTVTGPDGYSSNLTNNIQPVGTLEYIGSDIYTATTSDIITGGSDGDMYECTVTGLTSNTDSVELRG